MRPKIRATVVCVRGDKVLLVSKDGVRWALPGGRPDEHEVLADTAARELLEETAMKAKTLDFQSQYLGSTTVHHVFKATVSKSAEPRPNNEIKACSWFAWGKLDQLEASLTTKRIVAEVVVA